MHLRPLEQRDAPLMLEWMHDPDCVENLSANFASKTLEDCYKFIESSKDSSLHLNLAIADDSDEYMGTVSLKQIDRALRTAEFAISIRRCAMGKGVSKFGMRRILEIGLMDLKLDSVVWCVSPDNKRAVRFYDKNGYQRVDASEVRTVGYTPEQVAKFLWYRVTRSDLNRNGEAQI